jgi:hypothetical protein
MLSSCLGTMVQLVTWIRYQLEIVEYRSRAVHPAFPCGALKCHVHRNSLAHEQRRMWRAIVVIGALPDLPRLSNRCG